MIEFWTPGDLPHAGDAGLGAGLLGGAANLGEEQEVAAAKRKSRTTARLIMQGVNVAAPRCTQ